MPNNVQLIIYTSMAVFNITAMESRSVNDTGDFFWDKFNFRSLFLKCWCLTIKCRLLIIICVHKSPPNINFFRHINLKLTKKIIQYLSQCVNIYFKKTEKNLFTLKYDIFRQNSIFIKKILKKYLQNSLKLNIIYVDANIRQKVLKKL